MAIDLLIRGGRVVLGDRVETADIAIEGGRIAAIGHDLGPAKETIDATGLHVFPGLIDAHVHFNEPGRENWEGLATGSAALAAGGGTTFFDMPLNSDPPVLTGAQFDDKKRTAEAKSVTDFALWGGLTPDNLDHLDELAERGVIGFKAFMSNSGINEFAAVDDLTLYRGMRIAKKHGLIVAVHAESDSMTAALTAEIRGRGGKTWADYLASRPIVTEVEATQRAITLAAEVGCRLHIVHVSNSRSSELVRLAKSHSGADVTCETCPHYLALNTDDLHAIGARAKCAPPLRSKQDTAELWDDLAAGKFAFVASDHSPAPQEMKTGDDVFAIWGGIAGVQSTMAILLSHDPKLPLAQVAKLTAANVAERFGLGGKGSIAVGHDADLALVAVDEAFTLRRDDLLDRHKLSPYAGRRFRGLNKRTIVRGKTVFENGKIVSPAIGQLLRPALVPSPGTPGGG